MTTNGKRSSLKNLCALALAATAGMAPSLASAQAAKPITVRQQDFGTGINTLGMLLARSEGLFEKNGIDLKVNPPIFNAAGIANAVMQGQADIAFGGATAVVALIQQRRPVKIIAVIAQTFEAQLALTNASLESLAKRGITPNSPLADRLAALKGMKFASPAAGSSTDQVVRYAFRKFGVDAARDVVIQPLPDLAAILGAFRQGAVDGLMGTRGSGPAQVEADRSGRVLIAFEKEDKGLEVAPQHVLFATEDYIKSNPDAIRRVLAAHLDAKNQLRKGITQAQRERIKEQFFKDMAPATYNSLLDGTISILTGPMTPTAPQLDILLAIHNLAAETPAKLSFDQLFDSRFAEAAEKR